MSSIATPLFETLESRLFLDAAPGVVVLDAANSSATVTLDNGTVIQAKLGGRIDAAASVELTVTDDGFDKIDVDGTTASNSLVLTSKGRQAFDIGEINFLNGADLKTLKAPDGDLNGAGITGDADTDVTVIQLGDLANGADVTLPSAGLAKGITLQFDSVGDAALSEIVTGSGIRSFRTKTWNTGSVSIDAPWIRSLAVTDITKRSLSLAGPVNAGMHMTIEAEYDATPDRWLDSVTLTGTTGRNTLNIRSRTPAVVLGEIILTAGADLKALSAPTTVLTGDGLTGQADSEVSTVILNALVYGADIDLPSVGVAQGVNLKLRAVGTDSDLTDGDGSDIEIGSGIRSFRAVEWLGLGSASAPWINTFIITGQRNGVYGSMYGDINLTDVVAGRRYGLTKFSVAGYFGGSLNCAGNALGTVQMGSWGTVDAEGTEGGQVLNAATVRTLHFRGTKMSAQDRDLYGATYWMGSCEGVTISLSGTDAKGYSIYTFKVRSILYSVELETAGHVRTLDVGMSRKNSLFIGCALANGVDVTLEDEAANETWDGLTIATPSLLGQSFLGNFIVRNIPDDEIVGMEDSPEDWQNVPSLSFTSIAGASVRTIRLTDDFVTSNPDKLVDLGSNLVMMDMFAPYAIRSRYQNSEIDVSKDGEKPRSMKLAAAWSPTRGPSGSSELTSMWMFI